MLLTTPSTDNLSRDHLYQGKRVYFYDKGDYIPMKGKGIWQVYRGLIQLNTFHKNGEEVVIGWVAPTTLFNLQGNNLQVHEAKALTEVYLHWFSEAEMSASSDLTQTLLVQLNRRMSQAQSLLAIAGMKRVEDRLRALLSLLHHDLGQPTIEGSLIPVHLTHQTLASAIATTRVTVTRLLGYFQQQGEISLNRDRQIILKGDWYITD